MAGEELDRNEEATSYKLRKARERGQVARSAELGAAALFAVGMAYLAACGTAAVLALAEACRHAWASLQPMPVAGIGRVAHALLVRIAADAAAPFGLMLLAAIVAGLLQAGPVFAPNAVAPDPARLHPSRVLRRIFSVRPVFDVMRSLARLAVVGGIAWWAIERFVQAPALSALQPAEQLRAGLAELASLGLRIAVVLAAFAAWDLLRSRREFARDMRMSRREVRDEQKQREGDPRIRARLRELRRKLLKRSASLRNTRDADVVVTNPTHVAVALRYQEGRTPAPVVLAKGVGSTAAGMRGIAHRHGIAVVHSPALARRLFRQVEVEQVLPPGFHAEVAGIYAWPLAMQRRRNAQGQPA